MRNTTLKTLFLAIFLCALFFIISSFYIDHSKKSIQVAVTFDDLPFIDRSTSNKKIVRNESLALTNKIMAILKKHKIDSTWGFMIGKNVDIQPGSVAALKAWVLNGNKLGNHTYSHPDFAQLSAENYINDIQKNEGILQQVMGDKNYKVFRYPYLSYGETEKKYTQVRNFLDGNGYQIAEVTLDFFDYEWIPAYQRCLQKKDQASIFWLRKNYLEQSLYSIDIAHELSILLFKRDIKYVLLLHFNDIQADVLDQLLTQYENRGVKFISLESALSDPVYKIDPKIYRVRSYTLLNRIRLSRNLPNPANVNRLYATLPEEELNAICS